MQWIPGKKVILWEKAGATEILTTKPSNTEVYILDHDRTWVRGEEQLWSGGRESGAKEYFPIPSNLPSDSFIWKNKQKNLFEES